MRSYRKCIVFLDLVMCGDVEKTGRVNIKIIKANVKNSTNTLIFPLFINEGILDFTFVLILI